VRSSEQQPAQVHPTCVLGERVALGQGVVLGPLVVLGDDVTLGDEVHVETGAVVGCNVEVGTGSHLGASCVLRDGIRVGKRVRIGSGAVLGSDGFGFVEDGGTHHKIAQVGTVVVEDDVVIEANACIDRATMGATRIGRGCVVGALSQVGHNVVMASDCVLGAQAGLAGSSRLDAGVRFENGAGAAPHVAIGAGTVVGFRAGVIKNVGEGLALEGFPARPVGELAALEALLPQAAGLVARLTQLEARVAAGAEASAPRAAVPAAEGPCGADAC
jgi:UDP-3-O-[3-hydroxymyristoyl] glucosamine N-acyltransferase